MKKKHCITKKDLDSLSKKGKERLNEWYLQAEFSTNQEFYDKKDGFTMELPLLSIGGMIDFLGFIPHKISLTGTNFICDKLWKNVKEKLEK